MHPCVFPRVCEAHLATDILFYFLFLGTTTVFSQAQKVLTFYWELCGKVRKAFVELEQLMRSLAGSMWPGLPPPALVLLLLLLSFRVLPSLHSSREKSKRELRRDVVETTT